MTKLLKSDLYRLTNSKMLYGLGSLVAGVAVLLVVMIRHGVSLGIYALGNMVNIGELEDVIRLGIQYHNGLLGVVVVIILSVWIGQEYQWNTWQYKWVTSKSRCHMYLAKAIISALVSVAIYLLYQLVTLFSSGQVGTILSWNYLSLIIGGIFVYGALGTVICLITMSIKNNVFGVVVCLCYVLFIESLLFAVSIGANHFAIVGRIVDWGIRHSIYGMASVVARMDLTPGKILGIGFNGIIIMILATILGMFVFEKCEL